MGRKTAPRTGLLFEDRGRQAGRQENETLSGDGGVG